MSSGALERRLRAGEFAITAEITPPVSADPALLLERALPLKGLADAVNVTDGASARAHMDTLTAAGLLVRNGLEPVLQITCRDRNRIALQSLLLGAAAQGVPNLLALRGDDPSAGDQPDAKPVFDLDASALLRTAALMRDRGELPNGRAIQGRVNLFIGGADMPTRCCASSKPARSSCRRSSAWMHRCCAATWQHCLITVYRGVCSS
jgi:methylenetetrahydrofolate reductase (NADPH)